MAAEIRDQLGMDAELIQDRGGVYDVRVDGEIVFSKHAEGDRFPENGEVVQRIQELGANR